MKKRHQRSSRFSLALSLLLALLLMLTGCSNYDGGEPPELPSSEPVSSQENSEPSSEETSSEETSSEPQPASSAEEKKPASSAASSSAAPSSKAEKPAPPPVSSQEPPPSSEAPAESVPDNPVDSAGVAGRIEQEILRLVNEERSSLGLGALTWNNKLYQSAKVRSDEMAANHQADNIEHIRPDGSQWYTAIQGVGYSYTRSSENLLYIGVPAGADFDGGDVSAVAGEIFTGWKNSPSHYTNIIDSKVDETGIAVTYDGTDIYATQHFGKQ